MVPTLLSVVPTPPMLRAREPLPERPPGPDPVLAFTVFMLVLIGLGLFVAAFLAVYTYSTPDVEQPLVIAITLAFSLLVIVNVIRLGVRQLRQLLAGR